MKKYYPIVILGLLIVLASLVVAYQFIFATKPDQVTASFQKNLSNVKSAHFQVDAKMTVEGEEISVDGFGDMSKPSKYQMNCYVRTKNEETEYDRIVIGDQLYIKRPDLIDKWQATSFSQQDVKELEKTLALDPRLAYLCLKAVKSANGFSSKEESDQNRYYLSTEVGAEQLVEILESSWIKELEQSGWQKEKVKTVMNVFSNSKVKVEVWVGKEDEMPYKENIIIEIPDQPLTRLDATYKFSDFNKSFDIKAPNPQDVASESPLMQAINYHRQKGIDNYRTRDLEVAYDEFCVTTVLDPNNAEFWCWRGIAALSLNDFEEAAKCCKKALEINGEYPFAKSLRSILYLYEANPDKALDFAKEAEAHCKDNCIVYETLGAMYQANGYYSKAIDAYNKAINLDPQYVPPFLDKSIAYLMLGNIDKAQACCNEAIAVNPNYAEAHAAIGYIYMMRAVEAAIDGQEKREKELRDQAKAKFREALTIDPELKEAKIGIALLHSNEDIYTIFAILDPTKPPEQ